MIVVGLTGGIGSGKTTVAKIFESLGAPIYIADVEAKILMEQSPTIKKKLIALFGDSAYVDETLNRSYLSSQIFNDSGLLEKMNDIVHPEVRIHFDNWLGSQSAAYVIKEAAIIFELQKQDDYDYIITVVADKKKRISRVMKRDSKSKASIEQIIKTQFSDEEKIKRSDFIIKNNKLEDTKKQVVNIHKLLQDKASESHIK